MLPRNLVTIDSQLNVLKTLKRLASDTPLGGGDESSGAQGLAERHYDRLFTKCRDVIEDLLRESGDIAADSKLKSLSEPGKQLRHIDLLLAEVGPGSDQEFRRLVIVEDKLATNGESRRAVLAQVLDYAHIVQRSLTPDDLSETVVGAEWVEDNRDELSRAIREGDYLLIICGDDVRESLLDLLKPYGDRLGPLNASNVVLIAMGIYTDGQTNVFVPHIVGGINRATRDLTIRVVVQTMSKAPMDVGSVNIDPTPDPLARVRDTVTPPEVFMADFAKTCGGEAAAAWIAFAEALKGSAVIGLRFGNYDGGAPYVSLSNTSLGTVQLLRLADTKPVVRDRLNTAVWESSPQAQEARRKFRQALRDCVPNAAPGGKANRISAPVAGFTKAQSLVTQAIADLAADLRGIADLAEV